MAESSKFQNKLTIGQNGLFEIKNANLDASRYIDIDGGSSTEHAQLCYPSDIMDPVEYPAYTAFYISVHKSDTLSAQVFGGNFSKTAVTAGKTSWMASQESSRMNVEAGIGAKALIDIGNGITSGEGGKVVEATLGKVLKNSLRLTANEGVFSKISGENLATGKSVDTLNCTIVLPTPELKTSYGSNWDTDDEISNMMQMAGAGKTITNAASELAGGNVSQAANTLRSNSDALMVAMHRLDATKDFAALGAHFAGLALNPRAELTFKGISRRQFSYEYTMSPRNRREAASIEAIVAMFKYHSLPGLTNSGVAYTYPAQFDIVHFFQDKDPSNPNAKTVTVVNRHLPRHATAVLTSVEVSYSGRDTFYLEHGYPAFVTLSLSFMELGYVTKEDVLAGF